MIFPGMDPYLEHPQIWPGVHKRLTVYIADHLQPLLSPRYVASIEERVYVEGPNRDVFPDVWLRKTRSSQGNGTGVAVLETDKPVRVVVPGVEIRETYVAVLDRLSGEKFVTVIEVTSPTNKNAGPGRASYLAKQREVRASPAHLVEIDLLRTGDHVLAVPEATARSQGPYDYLVSVNPAHELRQTFDLYPRRLRERLPRIGVPLADDDPDVALDLQVVLEKTYEIGTYRDRLRYDQPCVPPLSAEDQAWADELIRQSRQ